jgi:hypothetical protein
MRKNARSGYACATELENFTDDYEPGEAFQLGIQLLVHFVRGHSKNWNLYP